MVPFGIIEAKVKATGEFINIIPNDELCAAKWVNVDTGEYVYDKDIEIL